MPADNVAISLRKLSPNAVIPVYATEGAAGADLFACLEEEQIIPPGKRALIPTGLALEIPIGYEGQVRPRSGLALKHGITVLNAPGTIDSDYRGELKIILINHGDSPFAVKAGDRIAQLVIAAHSVASFEEKAVLADSERAASGFGSTGI